MLKKIYLFIVSAAILISLASKGYSEDPLLVECQARGSQGEWYYMIVSWPDGDPPFECECGVWYDGFEDEYLAWCGEHGPEPPPRK